MLRLFHPLSAFLLCYDDDDDEGGMDVAARALAMVLLLQRERERGRKHPPPNQRAYYVLHTQMHRTIDTEEEEEGDC